MTALSVAILAGVATTGLVTGPRDNPDWIFPMVVLPLACMAAGAFFTIRGYEVTPDALWVRRPGWKSRIPIEGLVSADPDPGAMTRTVRTFGNGGLFCFAGAFWNRKIGHYRAFATDPHRSVVLRFAHRRPVVVTPEDPAAFASAIRRARGL